MLNILKRMTAVILCAFLLLPLGAINGFSAGENWENKIEQNLWTVMESNGDTDIIEIWLFLDFKADEEEINRRMLEEYGIDVNEWADPVVLETRVIRELEQELGLPAGSLNRDSAEVKERISDLANESVAANRRILRDIYTTYNKEFAEKYIPEGRIIYSSTFTADIHLKATKSEIEEYAKIPNVASIYMYEDIAPEEDEEVRVLSPLVGDVNGDREMDSLDAAQILRLDAGIIQKLPVEELEFTLDPQTEEQICEDYFVFKSFSADKGMEEITVGTYYGSYSDCHVVYMLDNEPETDNYWVDEVAGHRFVYGSGRQAYVYRDGDFYTFKEAYYGGYITAEDIYDLGMVMTVQMPDSVNVDDIVRHGDVNGDGAIDSLDAALILKYDVGIGA